MLKQLRTLVKYLLFRLSKSIDEDKPLSRQIEVKVRDKVEVYEVIRVAGLGLLGTKNDGKQTVMRAIRCADAVDRDHFVALWKELGGKMKVVWEDGSEATPADFP